MSVPSEVDYVIVGAGSAGCVLANRLSEDGTASVLLLEAGGSDRSIFIQMPTALSIPMNGRRYNWRYWSEPEPHLGGRQLHCPRGRVLGGSSSINGMVYVRGNALDFEGWAASGAMGWSYAEVLPYFRKSETYAGGGDAYRGDCGPLHVSNGPLDNPLYGAFVAAALEAGYPQSADMNGARQEGFGRMDMTVHRGRRWSTVNAYLQPARRRANLAVMPGALVTRILCQGRRATGVAFERHGAARSVAARRGVLLSAGPINTPQLLMLSGVGPAERIAALGLPVLHDLPGVGENLQDHLELYLQQACLRPITLYGAMTPLRKALIGVRWLLFKHGLGRHQPFRGGRLHLLAARRALSRYPVPFPADGGLL